MKKLILLFSIIICLLSDVWGQTPTDSIEHEHTHGNDALIDLKIKTWQYREDFFTKNYIEIDTSMTGIQQYNPVYRNSISTLFLGNLGLAATSNNFYHKNYDEYIFARAFSDYLLTPEKINFYNTTKHFTTLNYTTSSRKIEEQQLNVLHTQNINQTSNFGLMFNFGSSKGQYSYQTAKTRSSAFFANINKKNYSLRTCFTTNKITNNLNGGIDSIVIDDNGNELISVNMTTPAIELRKTNLMFSHGFSFGKTYSFDKTDTTASDSLFIVKLDSLDKERLMILKEDTLIFKAMLPRIGFFHTFDFERNNHIYIHPDSEDLSYYDTSYLYQDQTYDSAYNQVLSNSAHIRLLENKKSKFPFTFNAGIGYEFRNYYNLQDYLLKPQMTNENNGFLQSSFSTSKTNTHLYLFGKSYWLGNRQGNYHLRANYRLNLHLFKDTLTTNIDFSQKYENPFFFEKTYYSNHYRWHKTFDNKTTIHLKTSAQSQKMNIKLGFNYSLLNNYIYFDNLQNTITPVQKKDPISIMAVSLQKKIVFFNQLHLNNHLVYQMVSHSDVLPLPAIAYKLSLFWKHKFHFNVSNGNLFTEAGTDIFYHSAYKAPYYSPALNTFYNTQGGASVGNYPIIDVFLNFKVRKAILYLKLQHINTLIMQTEPQERYYLTPDYLIDDMTFYFGVNWRFHD